MAVFRQKRVSKVSTKSFSVFLVTIYPFLPGWFSAAEAGLVTETFLVYRIISFTL
jgi:hypothetical protein